MRSSVASASFHLCSDKRRAHESCVSLNGSNKIRAGKYPHDTKVDRYEVVSFRDWVMMPIEMLQLCAGILVGMLKLRPRMNARWPMMGDVYVTLGSW